MTLTHTIEVIDPAKAEDYLKLNTHNRRLNPDAVRIYARAMELGHWNFDGAPIRISDSNILLDGQTRLHAIILSGTAQQFSVWRGLPETSQETMDSGRKRSLADMLTLRGEKNSVAMSALTYTLYPWEQGFRGSSLTGSNKLIQTPEALRFIENNPNIRESATAGVRLGRIFPGPTRIWSLAHFLFNRIDKDDAAYFFSKLELGTELEEGSPILLLRNSISRFQSSITSRVDPMYMLAIIIKAWNLFREGNTQIKQLGFRAGGAKAELFPEPV